MAILKFDNVSKFFGTTVAVYQLNLEVEEGEFFGFLGPNGAGKTTTIKMATGLLHPTEGRITIGGLDIHKYPEEAKRLIGYIPDSPFIYEKLTGREFLHFVGGLYGMSERSIRNRVGWLFELFKIGDWGDELAGSYSHGMKQKIVFSSALLHNPKLIIIDEPLVGLDPQSQKLVKDVLSQLVSMNHTVFMSTHTLPVAEELCTRIGIIHEGKLLQTGTIDELKEQAHTKGTSLESLFLDLTGGKLEVWFPQEEDM